jgi:hypothetical protein
MAYQKGHIRNIRMTPAILAGSENNYQESIHSHTQKKGRKEISFKFF